MLKYAKEFDFLVEGLSEEDKHDIDTILDAAIESIRLKFNIDMGKDNKILGMMFNICHMQILSILNDMVEKYDSFSINICNRLEVGYSKVKDKLNISKDIKYKHMDCKKNTILDHNSSSGEKIVQWNTENPISIPSLDVELSSEIVDKLCIRINKMMQEKYDITIGISAMIMPIFVTTYEHIISYLKTRRSEIGEFKYEVNFLSMKITAERASDTNEVDDTIKISYVELPEFEDKPEDDNVDKKDSEEK